MGTTLTAYLELREPGHPWDRFATWHFQKNYTLMAALGAVAERDWPLDATHRNEPQYDHHRYWLGSADLGLVELPPEDSSPLWPALCGALESLPSVIESRVLFIEI